MPRPELIDIAGIVKHETDKAYLFFDGKKQEWLAKSQCEWDEATRTMTMPEWLALEKGFL